jgi:hypothetical protein
MLTAGTCGSHPCGDPTPLAATAQALTCVMDGRFANMTLHIGPEDEDTDYCLRRSWDGQKAIANANSTALEICDSYTTYSPWWDCVSNIPHKGVHTYIGGVVCFLSSSFLFSYTLLLCQTPDPGTN